MFTKLLQFNLSQFSPLCQTYQMSRQGAPHAPCACPPDLISYQHAIPAFVCVFKLILCEIFPPNAHNVINCLCPLTLSPTIAPHHADWSSPNPDLLSSQVSADVTTHSDKYKDKDTHTQTKTNTKCHHPSQISCRAKLTLM